MLVLNHPGEISHVRGNDASSLIDGLLKGYLHDRETFAHSKRVGMIAEKAGRLLGFDSGLLRILKLAGDLHDIGKQDKAIESIVSSSKPLSNSDRQVVNNHPLIGYRRIIAAAISAGSEELRSAATLTLFHHSLANENSHIAPNLFVLNGLVDKDISRNDLKHIMSSPELEVLVASDTADALRSKRPYKPSIESLSEIQLIIGATVRIDPKITEAVVEVMADYDRIETMANTDVLRTLGGIATDSSGNLGIYLPH